MNTILKLLTPAAVNTYLSEVGRLCFALTLFPYYLASALTKFDGLGLSTGAYYQIFPKAMEAVNYNASALSLFEHIIVALGSMGELLLPLFLLFGLMTRLSALGMLIFLAVQSYVDHFGHGVDVESFRLIWAYLFFVLLVLGGGRLSLDTLILQRLKARGLSS